VLLAGALYRQVLAKDTLSDVWAYFLTDLKREQFGWLILAVCLMPINWLLESLKWKQLIKQFSAIGLWATFKAVLAGVTISLFTPNRIGEYGGRILLIDAKNNWKAIVATLVGSYSQLLILFSGDLCGLLFFAGNIFGWESYWSTTYLLIGLTLLGLMLFFFFNIDLFVLIARRLFIYKRLKKVLKHVEVLKDYSNKDLGKALLFSGLRYLVYSLQYLFIIYFFGIKAEFLPALAAISTVFLLQTSIPLPPVAGLLARGEIALLVWSGFTENDLAILADSFSLFIINLCIPALLGVAVIVKVNVLKSLGYEGSSE